MFDFGIGTSELLLIAMVALIVVGPKELPGLLRTIGQWVRKVKALASEFQGHLDELTKEAGVDDLKDKVREEMDTFSVDDLDREFERMEREMREEMADEGSPGHDDEPMRWNEADESGGGESGAGEAGKEARAGRTEQAEQAERTERTERAERTEALDLDAPPQAAARDEAAGKDGGAGNGDAENDAPPARKVAAGE